MDMIKVTLLGAHLAFVVGATWFFCLRYGDFRENVRWNIINRRAAAYNAMNRGNVRTIHLSTARRFRWTGVHETVIAVAVIVFCVVPIFNAVFTWALVRPYFKPSTAKK